MSQQLISRNPDLKRLRDDGYNVSVQDGYLIVREVPYVTPAGAVARGILTTSLELANGDQTQRPTDHTVRFAGEYPCRADGSRYEQIVNSEVLEQPTPEIQTRFSFSSKPAHRVPPQYDDYYEKMVTYLTLLQAQAQGIDPEVTATTFPLIKDDDDAQSVFRYMDTASSRAGIADISAKLRDGRVAIVGVGGTGSYVLDLLAKTHIEEIHLFDGDRLLQHNLFRMPGTISEEDVAGGMGLKVDHLAAVYGRMRSGVIAHGEHITDQNLTSLDEFGFAFLCLTDGDIKRLIVDHLIERGVGFIDVGIGLEILDATLLGQLRTTTVTAAKSDHALTTIPFSNGEANEYTQNIQVADLNALNACLAVIKWKKLRGFYLDIDQEHNSIYQLDGNHLINEERTS